MIKNIFLLFSLLLFSFQISAQRDKLKWFTEMEAAKQYAATNQKDILLVFAGSDWCKPCIQFKKDILESTTFKNWGSEQLVVLYLDFPSRRKNKLSKEQTAHNEALAERFNKSGAFPNLFLMDTKETVLANPVFKNQKVDQFIAELTPSLTAQK